MGAPDETGVGRFELLAAIGEVADGSLPFRSTVERLLDLVVPAFADVALLDAVGSDGGLRRLGVRAQAPNRTELEAALMRRTIMADAPVGVAQAVATSRSSLLSPVTDDDLRGIASSEEDLELLRSLRLQSALFIPLRARGQVLGALACGVGLSGRRYRPEDLRYAEVLAGRISLALDNAGLSRMVRELERQLESTLENLAEAVLVRDPAGRVVFANTAVVKLLGFESVEAIHSATSEQLMDQYEAFDEHGVRLTLADLPSARALRGELTDPLLVRNVIPGTGAERWLLHKATPVFDSDGELSLVVNVIEDLTQVKRAELAQRLLADAGEALSSSMDYEPTLQRLASVAVPLLADWCGVRIRGPRNELDQVAVAHVDPEKVALAREFGEHYPTRVGDGSTAAEVVRTGRPQVVPEITEEMLDRSSLAEEQVAVVRDLQMRSVIMVPVGVAGQPPLGVMTMVMAESGRRFDEGDLELAAELGRRAGVAVENARLYTERSRIASTLQRSLLPEALPEIEGFHLASLYRPGGELNEVGGDFYDAFAIPSGWLILVGDVTGRGPKAAALTSLARFTMRTAARLLDDPLAAFEQLNIELRGHSHPSLVTIACALLQEGPQGTLAHVFLAGHPPPYHLTGGRPRQVGQFAAPLGAYEAGAWQPDTILLDPGDQLVLYTDGVIEAVGRTDRFGEERLADTLTGSTGAADAVARIDQALRTFAEGDQTDDTAVLAVERVATFAEATSEDVLLTKGGGPGSR